MLHGYGNQKFLKRSYEEDRKKALFDRKGFTTTELEELEITGTEGEGMTDFDNMVIYQNPFPIDTAIRPKRKINVRVVTPQLGESGDL